MKLWMTWTLVFRIRTVRFRFFALLRRDSWWSIWMVSAQNTPSHPLTPADPCIQHLTQYRYTEHAGQTPNLDEAEQCLSSAKRPTSDSLHVIPKILPWIQSYQSSATIIAVTVSCCQTCTHIWPSVARDIIPFTISWEFKSFEIFDTPLSKALNVFRDVTWEYFAVGEINKGWWIQWPLRVARLGQEDVQYLPTFVGGFRGRGAWLGSWITLRCGVVRKECD